MSDSELFVKKERSTELLISDLKRIFASSFRMIITDYSSLSSPYKRYITKRMLERMYSTQMKRILKEISFNPYGPFLVYVNEVDRDPLVVSIIEKIKKWRGDVISINLDPLYFKIPKQLASKYQYVFIINIEKNEALWGNISRLFGLLKTFHIAKERTVFFLTRRHYILERTVGMTFKIPLPSEKIIESCILSLNKNVSKDIAKNAARILVGTPARLIIDSVIKAMESLGYMIE
ncbi:MAG: hypothetical protein ACP6IS_12260 [Candidatus Asgardarchaeia archaeon]